MYENFQEQVKLVGKLGSSQRRFILAESHLVRAGISDSVSFFIKFNDVVELSSTMQR